MALTDSELRDEVGDLLDRIAALVRGRAFLRRAGFEAAELRSLDVEIERLHYRLADASRLSAVAETVES
jgi:hypothetical protein